MEKAGAFSKRVGNESEMLKNSPLEKGQQPPYLPPLLRGKMEKATGTDLIMIWEGNNSWSLWD